MRIDPNARIWSDAVLSEALTKAVNQIQQDGDFSWSFNDAENTTATVASQAAYTLPTDFVRIEADTVLWNNSVLEPTDYRYFLKNRAWITTDGTPSRYALRGNYIYLALRPNAIQNLTYGYRKKLTKMSADSDDSGMPDEFNRALTTFAIYLCFSDIEGKQDLAVTAIQSYNELMKGLFSQYLGTRDENNFIFSFETIGTYSSIL